MIRKISTENREEWKKLRSKYIGGSDAACVVGMNSYKSAYALWAEKTGKLPGFEGNLATEVGTYLEEFVAQKFAEVTGKKVRRCNQSILNDEYPWAIANIDREIVGEDAGLEIKTTSELNMSKFKSGEYPGNYYCQCVHYMAMTSKKRWYLAVLIGNRDFRWFTIERDEEEIAALMEEEKKFWKCVEDNVPPAPDGSESSSRTLAALHPDSNGESVGIGSFEKELDRYIDLTAQVKELEEQISGIANRVKAHLGDAGKGDGERYRVSWKTSERKTFDHKKLLAEHPEIDGEGYYKTSRTRRFLVTQKG